MGGYVSVPAVLGARLARKPSIIFEPNAAAGLANRWLSRVASEAAVAFEAAATALRCKTTTTGTPVREEFFSQPAEVPTGPLRLLILGGSQGAAQLNEIVPEALGQLGRAVRDLEVLHQAGPVHVETTRSAYASSAFPGAAEVVPFLDDVAGALGRASLVVSRAGAITLAEISAVGRPAVLVPLAIAAGHQAANARALVEAGGAEMLSSGGSAEALAKTLEGMLGSPSRLLEMGEAAAAAGRRDAVERFADRVVAQVGES
jgi:UDP-N-acetylglucosamine--N-acetylmuramyl-(pentapeptide) pyrophosphoryl-undecaprenol N-acetylglucosamine transferase